MFCTAFHLGFNAYTTQVHKVYRTVHNSQSNECCFVLFFNSASAFNRGSYPYILRSCVIGTFRSLKHTVRFTIDGYVFQFQNSRYIKFEKFCCIAKSFAVLQCLPRSLKNMVRLRIHRFELQRQNSIHVQFDTFCCLVRYLPGSLNNMVRFTIYGLAFSTLTT